MPAPVAETVCPGAVSAVTKPRWNTYCPVKGTVTSAPLTSAALFGSLSVIVIVVADVGITL